MADDALNGPPGKPAGIIPMLRRIITVQNIGAAVGMITLFGFMATWIGNYASAARHAAEFEISVDKRLVELASRQEATDRDRDTRSLANNTRLDTMTESFKAGIEELRRKLDERSGARTAELTEVKQDIRTLKLKLCVLSGRKVYECQ